MSNDCLEQLTAGKATTEQALAICDSLQPADLDLMAGNWKGSGFHTNHPMDGLLEAYHWHGKRFENTEAVHPLVFTTRRGDRAYLNPAFMGKSLAIMKHVRLPRSPLAGRLFQAAMPLFTTSRSRARLRMTTYRGQSSATMIYDQLPINDVFRKIDDDWVFGIMDYKKMETPFFFLLRRERSIEKN